MKILLDTHIILWYLNGDERLPQNARKIIDDSKNEIYFSLVSIWEVEIKHISHPDKMVSSGDEVIAKCGRAEFKELGLNSIHIKTLHTLHRLETAPKHNDPFDRMLIAQAKAEEMTFLTHDLLLPYYNEPCVLSV